MQKAQLRGDARAPVSKQVRFIRGPPTPIHMLLLFLSRPLVRGAVALWREWASEARKAVEQRRLDSRTATAKSDIYTKWAGRRARRNAWDLWKLAALRSAEAQATVEVARRNSLASAWRRGGTKDWVLQLRKQLVVGNALQLWSKQELAAGLRTWVAAAQARKELLRSAALTWLNLKLAAGWQSWLELLRARAAKRAVATNAMVLWTRCSLAAGLRTWIIMASERAAAMARLRQIVQAWLKHSLLAAWRSWLSTVAERQAKLFIARRVVTQWVRQQLAAALRAWLASVSARAGAMALLRSCLHRWAHQKLSGCVHTWRCGVAAALEERRMLQRCLSCLINRQQSLAIRKWAELLGSAASMRLVVRRMMHHELGRALLTWSEMASHKAAAKLRLLVLLVALTSRAVAAAWRTWLSMLAEREASLLVVGNALQLWSRQQLAAGLRTWAAAVQARKELLRSAALSWLNLKLADGWQSWLVAATRKESEQHILNTFVGHVVTVWFRNQLAWGWRVWVAAVSKLRLRVLLLSMEDRAVAVAWRMWQSMLIQRKATLLALLHGTSRQLAAGLRTWSAAVAAKKHQLRLIVLSELQRTAAAWRSWLCLLEARAETRVLMGHALASRTDQQLAVGLRTWVAAAVAGERQLRMLVLAQTLAEFELDAALKARHSLEIERVVEALEYRHQAADEIHSLEDVKMKAAVRLGEKLRELATMEAHVRGADFSSSAAAEALRATSRLAGATAAALALLPRADDGVHHSAEGLQYQAGEAAAESVRLQSTLDEEKRHMAVRSTDERLEALRLKAELRAQHEAAVCLVDEAESWTRRTREERGSNEHDASQALASAEPLPRIAWPPPSPPAAVLAAVVRQRAAAQLQVLTESWLDTTKQELQVGDAAAALRFSSSPAERDIELEVERRLKAARQQLVATQSPAAHGSLPPFTPPRRVATLRERADGFFRDALVASSSSPARSTGRTHEYTDD